MTPTPQQMAECKGVVARVTVAGGGTYATDRTTLDHAKAVVDRFAADLFAALQPGANPLVPFPAGGARVEVNVLAHRVAAVEVVYCQANGTAR